MTAVDLNGKTALVTGGAGFVGSHLVDALIREKAGVRVVDNLLRGGEENLTWAKANGSISVENADIRDENLWEKVVPGVDVVFHQAALRVTRCEENPQECWDVMVTATLNLLKACVRHKVKKVVLASSAIVYGAADTLPTPESHHLNNNSTWYGTAKIANEQMINAFYAHDKMPGVVLRYFNVYGTRMATKGHTEVFIKWMEAMDQGKPIRIFGDKNQTMDWVNVIDIAQANIKAAKASVSNGVFNVGTGKEHSLMDVGRLLLKAANKKEEPQVVNQAPTNSIPRRVADISRAISILGYKPQIDLETGLEEMVEWWRQVCLNSKI